MFSWIASHPFAYPALTVVHLVGIALLLGSLVVFELRVWGLATVISVVPLARLSLRVSVSGFCIAACSGLLLFASQADEVLANRAFWVKMALLLLAGCNAALFHIRGGPARLDMTARMQTLLSLGLWIGVIICGRWIAYV